MRVIGVLCLFVIALAYADEPLNQPSSSLTCKPGETFQVDCNTCVCGDNGLPQACTLMICNPECAVGETKYEDCNRCSCTHGKWACTRRACVDKYELQTTDDFPELPIGPCEPGKAYKKDCNTCVCNTNGIDSACTFALCPNRVNECSDGDTKYDGCNHCNCAHGAWACTRRSCPVILARTQIEANVDGTCEPGTQFKIDCNTCRCNEDGKSSSCTKIGCITANPEPECSPGDTKEEDCNHCNCAKGNWACTRRMCVNLIEVKIHEELPELPADGLCGKEKQYKLDCNICNCHEEGKHAMCTLKGCPPKRIKDLPDLPADGICGKEHRYKQDCNTCICPEEGKPAACTLMGCLPKLREDLPELPADGKCGTEPRYKSDCNTCMCAGEGSQPACTLKACLPKPECEQGALKKDGCNSCHCARGKWACTRMACVDANGCLDGQTKKDDCNDCTCSDGHWACTDMACPAP